MYSAVLFKRFQSATAFNGDVTAWDTSRVTELFTTFHKASAFNGDLTNWNIDKVTTMTNIFTGATSFKRTLCGSKWSSLNAFSAGNGRSGCCAIDRYMLNPFLTPFVESQACSACPNGQYRPKLNSDLHCGIYQKEPLPNGIPDSATVGLRKVVKDYLDTPNDGDTDAVSNKWRVRAGAITDVHFPTSSKIRFMSGDAELVPQTTSIAMNQIELTTGTGCDDTGGLEMWTESKGSKLEATFETAVTVTHIGVYANYAYTSTLVHRSGILIIEYWDKAKEEWKGAPKNHNWEFNAGGQWNFGCGWYTSPILVDAYNAVIAKYGLMEEWDVSQVTNMKNVFVGRSGFNLDISKWVCDWFCCGFDFYFGCTSTLTFSPLTHSFFQNSNRTQNRMCPTWLTWNRFLTVQLPSTKISMHGIRLQLRP